MYLRQVQWHQSNFPQNTRSIYYLLTVDKHVATKIPCKKYQFVIKDDNAFWSVEYTILPSKRSNWRNETRLFKEVVCVLRSLEMWPNQYWEDLSLKHRNIIDARGLFFHLFQILKYKGLKKITDKTNAGIFQFSLYYSTNRPIVYRVPIATSWEIIMDFAILSWHYRTSYFYKCRKLVMWLLLRALCVGGTKTAHLLFFLECSSKSPKTLCNLSQAKTRWGGLSHERQKFAAHAEDCGPLVN